MTTLAERIAKFNIPPAPYLPQGKNVLVFRLPSETRTAGGLYVPGEAEEAKPCGVLLAAGLEARDIMRDALIELGHVIWFGRFAGWEKEVQRDPEGKGKNILQMKVEDILGSTDAIGELSDNYTIEYDEETGEHFYQRRGAKKNVRKAS